MKPYRTVFVLLLLLIALMALYIVGTTCTQSIPLKYFVVFSTIYGFLELYRWSKNK